MLRRKWRNRWIAWGFSFLVYYKSRRSNDCIMPQAFTSSKYPVGFDHSKNIFQFISKLPTVCINIPLVIVWVLNAHQIRIWFASQSISMLTSSNYSQMLGVTFLSKACQPFYKIFFATQTGTYIFNSSPVICNAHLSLPKCNATKLSARVQNHNFNILNDTVAGLEICTFPLNAFQVTTDKLLFKKRRFKWTVSGVISF